MAEYAVLNQPLKKYLVDKGTRFVVRTGKLNYMSIARSLQFGLGKSKMIMSVLTDAGVVSKADKEGKRKLIIRDEEQAVNAALRQLNKGNK